MDSLKKRASIILKHSPIFEKDSSRIIMTLVAYFDLKLHQMDVRAAFLNKILEEEVYMEQPEGLSVQENNGLVYK